MTQSVQSRKDLLTVVLLTLFGSAIRFYHLGMWPLWSDEILTLIHSFPHRNFSVGYSIMYTNPLPWLAHFVTARLFGSSPLTTRIWPFLVGVASIPTIWMVARSVGGRRVAIWSTALLTVAPWHVLQSQNARHYTLQMLLAMLLFHAVYQGMERNQTRDHVSALVVGLLLVLTRPSSVYMFSVVVAYPALIYVIPSMWPAKVNWRAVLAVACANVVYSVVSYIHTLYVYPDIATWGHSPFNVVGVAIYYFTPTVIAIATVTALVGMVARNRLVVFLSIYAFLPVIMVTVTAAVHFGTGIVAFMSLPALLMLIAWTIAELRQRVGHEGKHLVLALGLGVIALFAGRTVLYLTVEYGHRPRLRDAGEYLAQHVQPTDRIYASFGMAEDALEDVLREFDHANGVQMFETDAETPSRFDSTAVTWFVVEDVYSTWNLRYPAHDWIRAHATMRHGIPAYFGPRSRSLWIYKYEPADAGLN
jgi:hypothetical protein